MRSHRRWLIPVLVVLVVLAAVYAIRDGDNELEQARAECEARDGHTELLPASSPLYVCYEVTVLDDGWRICNASDPWLQVRVETPPQSSEFPCGNTAPRWPSDEPQVEEVVIEEVVIEEAPTDCKSARDWYADHLESVIDEMNRVVALAETGDPAAVQSWFGDLGHLFEQNGRRAEAAQASCATGENLGIYLAISEARDELNETYKSIVEGCLTDGIHECTALAPTPKAECEWDPEFVYLLDEFALSDWPHTAASGCSLRK